MSAERDEIRHKLGPAGERRPRKRGIPKGVLTYNLDPYRHEVLFTTRRSDFADIGIYLGADQLDADGCDGRVAWLDDEAGARIYVIGVFKPCVAALAHECSHVVFNLFERLGIDARDSTGEAFCYLLQGMVERFAPNLE